MQTCSHLEWAAAVAFCTSPPHKHCDWKEQVKFLLEIARHNYSKNEVQLLSLPFHLCHYPGHFLVRCCSAACWRHVVFLSVPKASDWSEALRKAPGLLQSIQFTLNLIWIGPSHPDFTQDLGKLVPRAYIRQTLGGESKPGLLYSF